MPTLPVLLRARDDPAGGRPAARAARRGAVPTTREHAEALGLLRAHPVVGSAQAEVLRWADDAREVLGPLPEVPAKAALAALCDQVVGRTA